MIAVVPKLCLEFQKYDSMCMFCLHRNVFEFKESRIRDFEAVINFCQETVQFIYKSTCNSMNHLRQKLLVNALTPVMVRDALRNDFTDREKRDDSFVNRFIRAATRVETAQRRPINEKFCNDTRRMSMQRKPSFASEMIAKHKWFDNKGNINAHNSLFFTNCHSFCEWIVNEITSSNQSWNIAEYTCDGLTQQENGIQLFWELLKYEMGCGINSTSVDAGQWNDNFKTEAAEKNGHDHCLYHIHIGQHSILIEKIFNQYVIYQGNSTGFDYHLKHWLIEPNSDKKEYDNISLLLNDCQTHESNVSRNIMDGNSLVNIKNDNLLPLDDDHIFTKCWKLSHKIFGGGKKLDSNEIGMFIDLLSMYHSYCNSDEIIGGSELISKQELWQLVEKQQNRNDVNNNENNNRDTNATKYEIYQLVDTLNDRSRKTLTILNLDMNSEEMRFCQEFRIACLLLLLPMFNWDLYEEILCLDITNTDEFELFNQYLSQIATFFEENDDVFDLMGNVDAYVRIIDKERIGILKKQVIKELINHVKIEKYGTMITGYPKHIWHHYTEPQQSNVCLKVGMGVKIQKYTKL